MAHVVGSARVQNRPRGPVSALIRIVIRHMHSANIRLLPRQHPMDPRDFDHVYVNERPPAPI
ncbi:hypothetical protein PISMIDRAFT_681342 [Pisolithus microcarpus 441]|uniref:Uncharacterized protein n=1 Tax=Pisolithus microcarpus 441 TaxID=765257 RepID=A0A0C9Y9P7_9AGAM|nr:hypothetical protein PISMIDRAFT_681342 [Pisolithus microcarpus 441]